MAKNSNYKIKKTPRYSRNASPLLIEDENDLFNLIDNAKNPLLLILEGVQDPHNLGACLRTASGAGVLAVVVPKKGSCGITHTVKDIACGGADEVPFLKVTNIQSFIRKLRDKNIQIIGTSDKGTKVLYETNLKTPTAFIFGNEGLGIRKTTKSLCDQLVSIPMQGEVECLNISVSAGVCLYESVRQRFNNN